MARTILICLLVSLSAVAYAAPKSKLTEHTDANGVTWIGPIRKCEKGDDSVLDDCVRKIVKDLTPLVGSGIDEIELRPLDPIDIDKFIMDRSLGPINITIQAKNTKIMGFTSYKNLQFRTDAKNKRMKFLYEVPYLRVETNYKLGGKAFFFPLTGSGPANFEIFNLRVEGVMQGKITRNSDGEEVVQVEKTTFQKMMIGDMNLKIRGLFDGNALLSSVVHYIGKRYASQVFDVIRPEIENFAGEIISNDLLNPILNRLPYIVDYIPRD